MKVTAVSSVANIGEDVLNKKEELTHMSAS